MQYNTKEQNWYIDWSDQYFITTSYSNLSLHRFMIIRKTGGVQIVLSNSCFSFVFLSQPARQLASRRLGPSCSLILADRQPLERSACNDRVPSMHDGLGSFAFQSDPLPSHPQGTLVYCTIDGVFLLQNCMGCMAFDFHACGCCS